MSVTIHRNRRERPGRPGDIVAHYPDLPAANDGLGHGSYRVPLPGALKLKQGRHWVSVQANIDFQVGGLWGWETTRTQRGRPGMWKNPGSGFETGCVDYQRQLHCLGQQGQGAGFMFELHGRARPRTPAPAL